METGAPAATAFCQKHQQTVTTSLYIHDNSRSKQLPFAKSWQCPEPSKVSPKGEQACLTYFSDEESKAGIQSYLELYRSWQWCDPYKFSIGIL